MFNTGYVEVPPGQTAMAASSAGSQLRRHFTMRETTALLPAVCAAAGPSQTTSAFTQAAGRRTGRLPPCKRCSQRASFAERMREVRKSAEH